MEKPFLLFPLLIHLLSVLLLKRFDLCLRLLRRILGPKNVHLAILKSLGHRQQLVIRQLLRIPGLLQLLTRLSVLADELIDLLELDILFLEMLGGVGVFLSEL